MKKILKDIQSRVESEQRTPGMLFGEIKGIGARLFFSRQLYRQDVVTLCADLISMFEKLSSENTESQRNVSEN